MNIKQLEYFKCIAEAKSISKAAEKLNMSEPPISRQLSLLEKELHTPLFIRTNKGIDLTEAGEVLYQRTLSILNNLDALQTDVQEAGRGVGGVLRVGMVYSAANAVLRSLKAYTLSNPTVELYTEISNPDQLIDKLRKGELHVVFLQRHGKTAHARGEVTLFEDPIELIMTAETDPCPGQAVVEADMLRQVRLCVLRRDDSWRYSQELIDYCVGRGFTPQIACQAYNTSMLAKLIGAGIGVSYLPRSLTEDQRDGSLYSKPIRGMKNASSVVMLWDDNAYHSATVADFYRITAQSRVREGG